MRIRTWRHPPQLLCLKVGPLELPSPAANSAFTRGLHKGPTPWTKLMHFPRSPWLRCLGVRPSELWFPWPILQTKYSISPAAPFLLLDLVGNVLNSVQQASCGKRYLHNVVLLVVKPGLQLGHWFKRPSSRTSENFGLLATTLPVWARSSLLRNSRPHQYFPRASPSSSSESAGANASRRSVSFPAAKPAGAAPARFPPHHMVWPLPAQSLQPPPDALTFGSPRLLPGSTGRRSRKRTRETRAGARIISSYRNSSAWPSAIPQAD